MVIELPKNPKRRFTLVQIKYFYMWYTRQNKKTKDIVYKLIDTSQLELIQGGWSTNDEACPNYEDIINNMYIGHNFLKREFGVVPKIGWSLGSHGHSVANSALYSDMGFDAVFMSPSSSNLTEAGPMTFLWRPFSKHFGNQKQIRGGWTKNVFTGSLPLQTDRTLQNYNAEEKAIDLINHV